jgi:hypothetical protein
MRHVNALLLFVVLAACGWPNDPSLARSDAAHETARLTREEAVVIARDAAPQAAGRPVTFAEAGRLSICSRQERPRSNASYLPFRPTAGYGSSRSAAATGRLAGNRQS